MFEILQQLRQAHPQDNPRELLNLGQKLRQQYESPQAIWLMQQLQLYWEALRLEAFRHPELLLYEAQALQMGSRWPLAQRRALEIRRRHPGGPVWEIGAGIGGDSLELAQLLSLNCWEIDPQRHRCLEHNLKAYPSEFSAEAHCGDAFESLGQAQYLFSDPARRDDQGRRHWGHMTPDPRRLWATGLPGCLKLAPGLDETLLPQGCDLDYVSHQGRCKEACVFWPGQGRVQAWLYRQGQWLSAPRQSPPPLGPLEVGMWLHEPDPAAIRAQIWRPQGAWRIDETLALLASEPGTRSPWTQTFAVLEIADGDRKNLVRLQKQHQFYPLEIKKRGFDVDPEELRKRLPQGQGGGPGVLFLTRVAGRHRALVCRRLTEDSLLGDQRLGGS